MDHGTATLHDVSVKPYRMPAALPQEAHEPHPVTLGDPEEADAWGADQQPRRDEHGSALRVLNLALAILVLAFSIGIILLSKR